MDLPLSYAEILWLNTEQMKATWKARMPIQNKDCSQEANIEKEKDRIKLHKFPSAITELFHFF